MHIFNNGRKFNLLNNSIYFPYRIDMKVKLYIIKKRLTFMARKFTSF